LTCFNLFLQIVNTFGDSALYRRFRDERCYLFGSCGAFFGGHHGSVGSGKRAFHYGSGGRANSFSLCG
jgi:hypothetical protein